MAKNLAVNSKFNICIIGRNQTKMEQKLQEISELTGKTILTKFVIADFDKMFTIDDYESALEPLKELDIGMLILNAGWAQMGPFETITNQEMQSHININILHVAYSAKVLATQLVTRFEKTGKKSALVITSSGLGLFPCAGCIAYSCGKAFDHYLALGLSVEFAGKVDVLSYNAGMVNSPFQRNEDVQKNMQNMMITPDAAATACFRDVGYQEATGGAFKHCVGNYLTPPRLASKSFFKMSPDIYKEEMERQARNKKE